jgi:hypothetical protein
MVTCGISCVSPYATVSCLAAVGQNKFPKKKLIILQHAPTMSKHFLFFHNDAHNYKITGILKQLKFR